jgi:hypothetical protein
MVGHFELRCLKAVERITRASLARPIAKLCTLRQREEKSAAAVNGQQC